VQISIETLNYLIFIIPGFTLVWSFRYFTRSERKGEFELAGLSFLAGLLTLSVAQLIYPPEKLTKLLQNPYSTTLVFSAIALTLGFLCALFSKTFDIHPYNLPDWIIKKTDTTIDWVFKKIFRK
jgi:hypothetical protein